jgi:hypothetical protein
MVFIVLILSLLISTMAFAQPVEFSSMGRQTSLHTQQQPGGQWREWPSSKPPGYAYRAYTQSLTTLDGNVTMPLEVQPGTYKVWVKSELASTALNHQITLHLNTGDLSKIVNDKDADVLWEDFGVITVVTPFTSFGITMSRGGAILDNLGFQGVYFTTELDALVTKDDYAMVWALPGVEDTTAAISGNYVKNASFENGLGEVTLGTNEPKWYDESDMWSTAQAHTGTRSLYVNSKNCIQGKYNTRIRTRPYMLRPNRRHSAGVWFKSTVVGAKIQLKIIPALEVPKDDNNVAIPGIPAYPVFSTGELVMANTGWNQIRLENQLLIEYPEGICQYAIEVLLFDSSVNFPAVDSYIDDLQLSEGVTLPAFTPAFTQEIHVSNTRPGGRYYVGQDSTRIALRVFNSGTAATVPVTWELWDSTFTRTANGTASVVCGASEVGEQVLTFDSLPFGPYRLTAWLANGSENETYFARMHPPVAGVDPLQSMFGNHIDTSWYSYQLAKGIGHWNRVLSPAAWFRWELVEPTQGNFVFFDDMVIRGLSSGMMLLGNLNQDHADWANRTFVKAPGTTSFTEGGAIEFYDDSTGSAVLTGEGTTVWIPPASSPAFGGIQFKETSGSPVNPPNGLIKDLTSGLFTRPTTARFASGFSHNATPDYHLLINFMTQVVNHWKDKIKWWEICNEPHQDSKMPKFPMSGGSAGSDHGFYAQVAREATSMIRAACPDCKIVGLGGINSVAQMEDMMVKAGTAATSEWEATSVHLYETGLDAAVEGQPYYRMEDLVRESTQNGVPNVWHTETSVYNNSGWYGPYVNWRTAGNNAVMKYRDCENQLMSWTLATDRIVENMMLTIGGGAKKHFYYDARWHHQYGDSTQAFDRTFTSMDMRETLKPHGVAHAQMVWLLEGCTSKGSILSPTHSRVWSVQRRDGTILLSVAQFGGALPPLDPALRSMTWGLSTSKYKLYDVFANEIPASGSKILYGVRPTLIAGLPGTTWEEMRDAVISGTTIWAVEPDTEAPHLVIGGYPKITTSPLNKHLARVRWLAWDNVDYLQAAWIDGTSFRHQVDGGAFSLWDQTCFRDLKNLASGSHSVTVEARDKALNPTSKTVTFNIP